MLLLVPIDASVTNTCVVLNLPSMQLQVLSDALAGKRVEVAVNESAYWRSFGGDQSPEDLETALQLVYRCVRVVGSA